MDLKLGRQKPSGNQRWQWNIPLFLNGGLSIATFDYCRVSKLYFGFLANWEDDSYHFISDFGVRLMFVAEWGGLGL